MRVRHLQFLKVSVLSKSRMHVRSRHETRVNLIDAHVSYFFASHSNIKFHVYVLTFFASLLFFVLFALLSFIL